MAGDKKQKRIKRGRISGDFSHIRPGDDSTLILPCNKKQKLPDRKE